MYYGILIWHVDNNAIREDSYNINPFSRRPGMMALFNEKKTDGSGFALDFKNTRPDYLRPFYSKGAFNAYFENVPGHEEGLRLPLYGKGDDANDPDKRTLSGITIEFPDDPGREMTIRVKIEEEENEEKENEEKKNDNLPLSEVISEGDKKIINDDSISSSEKNRILIKADEAIDRRVTGYSDTIFKEPAKGKGKDSGNEYSIRIKKNSGLRFDGRKHGLAGGKNSKSKNRDINVKFFYCVKAGDYAAAPPPADKTGNNGNDGWTEAAVSKVNIANMKGNATMDYMGNMAGGKKGYGKCVYISGITLKDKKLNMTIGKAVNGSIKAMVKKLKKDKTTVFTDGDLEGEKTPEETGLIIPVYPLFLGDRAAASVSKNAVNDLNRIKNGDGSETGYTVDYGKYAPNKKKLSNASVTFSYEGSVKKKKALKYSSKKTKDLETAIYEFTGADGTKMYRLAFTGNYFGFVDQK